MQMQSFAIIKQEKGININANYTKEPITTSNKYMYEAKKCMEPNHKGCYENSDPFKEPLLYYRTPYASGRTWANIRYSSGHSSLVSLVSLDRHKTQDRKSVV